MCVHVGCVCIMSLCAVRKVFGLGLEGGWKVVLTSFPSIYA